MTRPKIRLSPSVVEYCQRCTDEERLAIVGYCCYLAFADRSFRQLEVVAVRAVAEQMGFELSAVASMARQVRKRRLKAKVPQSIEARKLLFHLAIHLAATDQEVDTRERAVIDRLADQLHVPSDVVDDELRKLGFG